MDNKTPTVDLNLIERYNVPGPRYTSYPTAVQFKEEVKEIEIDDYLKKRNAQPRDLSLYVHIPFCFSLCWYCGCTKIITRDQSQSEAYLKYVELELQRWAKYWHPESRVIQLHLGGGTPTFLQPEELKQLMAIIRKYATFADDAEISIEIDPRRLTEAHIEALAEVGFNRASLGIQDTNPEVQEAIHRIQPFEQNKQAVQWLRKHGITSVNLDLIYGLPKQTLETVHQTLDEVLKLVPNRLAVYSYAHVPWMMPAQKLLNEEDFPPTREKLMMLKYAIDELTDRGYTYIGMDHFARDDDELAIAKRNGTLQRNFQGYSTRSGADLYALGMSGISNIGSLYLQNVKSLPEYYQRLEDEDTTILKTCWLTKDDRLRREVIMQIMCEADLSFEDLNEQWDIDAARYFQSELARLEPLEKDGFLIHHPDRLQITPQGRYFLRNIAMQFDAYLQAKKQQDKQQFSKTV
ncbi:MAG: oxygen-independent coproporphyrinogen III oxidase [Bacteroidota bacterium]